MAAASTPPPIAHAIGGSLGSALALLLFYPLERARIELQSSASRARVTPSTIPELDSVDAEVNLNEHLELHEPNAKILEERENETEPITEDSSSWKLPAVVVPKKQGLLDCLVQLQKRNSLYTGVTPVVTTILTSQFVFFYMHAFVKRFFHTPGNNRSSTALLSLLSSCLAGLGNVFITNPLWVVNMAIVTGETKTSSLWKELYAMTKERGVKHMWNGTSASVMLVSNPVIQFFCYEQMKLARLSKKTVNSVLPPLEAFVIGAMAKGVATVTTYPLQLAQTVLRLKENGYKGTFDCLFQLYKQGGTEKLFTGMRAKLLQTVLTAAFTFLTYEQILGVVHSALLKGAQIP